MPVHVLDEGAVGIAKTGKNNVTILGKNVKKWEKKNNVMIFGTNVKKWEKKNILTILTQIISIHLRKLKITENL
jgi:hypothetical protein